MLNKFEIRYVQVLYNSTLADIMDSAEIPILDNQIIPETKERDCIYSTWMAE